jgi:hypothetical protein
MDYSGPDLQKKELGYPHLALLANLRRLSEIDNVVEGSFIHSLVFREVFPASFDQYGSSTKRKYKKDGSDFLDDIRDALSGPCSRERVKQFLTRNAAEFLMLEKNKTPAKQLKLYAVGSILLETYRRSEASEQQPAAVGIQQGASQLLSSLLPDDDDDYDIHRQTEEFISSFHAQQTSDVTMSSEGSYASACDDDDLDFSSPEFCRSYLASSHVSEELREQYEAARRDIILNDILPGRVGDVELSMEQLSILCNYDRNDSDEYKISYRKWLAHVSCREGITQAAVDRILKDHRRFKFQIDHKDLPTTAKTLLKISPEDTRFITMRDIYGPVVVGRGTQKTASYMHLGILNSLLLRSPGVVKKWHYINIMRTVHTLFPDFLPDAMQAVIGLHKGEEYDPELIEKWNNLPKPDPSKKRKLVLEIHGHIDGVKWFENSTQADEITGECVKTTSLGPFVIGVMQATKSAVNTKEFVRDFVYELRKLADQEMSGLDFKVTITTCVSNFIPLYIICVRNEHVLIFHFRFHDLLHDCID